MVEDRHRSVKAVYNRVDIILNPLGTEVLSVWKRRQCGCRRTSPKPWGTILIAMGAGIFLAHIIPYYLLITLLGSALIVLGICCIMR